MKTNLRGTHDIYRKMFKQIMNWGEPMGNHNDLYQHGTHPILGNQDDNYIFNLGYLIEDLPYHNGNRDTIKRENDIYERISKAYYCLVKVLSEAIGYDYEKYDPESPMYQYHLKNLNVNEILK